MPGISDLLFGYVGPKLADTILAKFRPNEIGQDLQNTIEAWLSNLPDEAYVSSPYTLLIPRHVPDSELEKRPALIELRSLFEKTALPTTEHWHRALLEQWHHVKNTAGDPQLFFNLPEEAASQHLRNLAEMLTRVCEKHASLFRPAALGLMRDILDESREHSEVLQTLLDQQKLAKTKRWRRLATCAWRGRPMEDTHCQWYQDVVKALRTAFSEEYQDFVAILQFRIVEVNGSQAWMYQLRCAKPVFCRILRDERQAIHEWHTLASKAQDIENEKKKLIDHLKIQWQTLLKGWQWYAAVAIHDMYPIAIHVIYDPSMRRITIREPELKSTDPAEYPDRFNRISELLMFLAQVVANANERQGIRVNLGNINWWRKDYRMEKLLAYLIDSAEFDFSRVRVNVDDDEDWDFINTDYDKLVEEFE